MGEPMIWFKKVTDKLKIKEVLFHPEMYGIIHSKKGFISNKDIFNSLLYFLIMKNNFIIGIVIIENCFKRIYLHTGFFKNYRKKLAKIASNLFFKRMYDGQSFAKIRNTNKKAIVFAKRLNFKDFYKNNVYTILMRENNG